MTHTCHSSCQEDHNAREIIDPYTVPCPCGGASEFDDDTVYCTSCGLSLPAKTRDTLGDTAARWNGYFERRKKARPFNASSPRAVGL